MANGKWQMEQMIKSTAYHSQYSPFSNPKDTLHPFTINYLPFAYSLLAIRY
jgi:hypothetical protein